MFPMVFPIKYRVILCNSKKATYIRARAVCIIRIVTGQAEQERKNTANKEH